MRRRLLKKIGTPRPPVRIGLCVCVFRFIFVCTMTALNMQRL